MEEQEQKKELETKINKIKKHFNNKNLFLEIYFLNYEGINLYIRIDYIRKLKVYKVNWFNLNVLNLKKIERYMGSEYINSETIEYMIKILEGKENNFHKEEEKNTVILNCYYENGYHYQFTKYIPKELSFLKEIFITIFNILPRKLEEILYELQAEIMETKSVYQYEDELEFDLFKDDLTKIFDKKNIEKGKRYYKENQVEFLEKIDDKYYCIINGKNKYLNVIKYNEETKKLLFYCTCSCRFFCKHIYSIIKAIRDNKIKKFYKVIYINKQDNLIENTTNNKYLLCSGIEDDCLEIINKYGEIELVPILDNDNKLNFKILEDDEKNTLAKNIKKIVDKN